MREAEIQWRKSWEMLTIDREAHKVDRQQREEDSQKFELRFQRL